MEHKKDKVKTTIEDLLKSHKHGLTIAEIMKKTKLARHTVLARLHELIGEDKVDVRQINMAKLHFWKTQLHKEEKEENPIKHDVKLTELQEHHIKENKKEIISKSSKKPFKIDMEQIKKDIAKEMSSGRISKSTAQIQEQRVPIKKILSQTALKATPKKSNMGVETGIEGLDQLFVEGIPKGSSILIAGGAGAGKTVLGLQILKHHARMGKKCLYMSFEESEARLMQHMEDFGWNPKSLMDKGNLMIKRFNPFDITRSVDALLMKAKGELLIDVNPIILPKDYKPEIIVVDSLTAIASAFTGKEDTYRIYIEQLFRFFEKIGATSFMITETKQIPTIYSQTGVEEFLADGVVVLYNIKRGNIRENAIEVLKLRGAQHLKRIVAFQITEEGIVVYPDQEVFGEIKEEE